jgi:hypothetical protein
MEGVFTLVVCVSAVALLVAFYWLAFGVIPGP